jgi:hypothetical protein
MISFADGSNKIEQQLKATEIKITNNSWNKISGKSLFKRE